MYVFPLTETDLNQLFENKRTYQSVQNLDDIIFEKFQLAMSRALVGEGDRISVDTVTESKRFTVIRKVSTCCGLDAKISTCGDFGYLQTAREKD